MAAGGSSACPAGAAAADARGGAPSNSTPLFKQRMVLWVGERVVLWVGEHTAVLFLACGGGSSLGCHRNTTTFWRTATPGRLSRWEFLVEPISCVGVWVRQHLCPRPGCQAPHLSLAAWRCAPASAPPAQGRLGGMPRPRARTGFHGDSWYPYIKCFNLRNESPAVTRGEMSY